MNPDRITVSLTVNGSDVTVEVDSNRTLVEMLREELGLTGTHVGCEHGVCGACTVLLDGDAVRSCLVLAAQAQNGSVETIESLAGPDGTLHPIQQAMVDEHGFQCAFCAPGFLMTIKAMLDHEPDPSPAAIREELGGNLCRCTGYASILAGVETAIRTIRSATNA